MDYELIAKVIFGYFFYFWNVFEGAKIDTKYPKQLVVLYFYPLFRILLLSLLIAGCFWIECLGVMLALAIFFYFMDLQLLLYKEI
jgi:hypothetical protein